MDTNKYTLKLYWEQVRKHKVGFFVSLIFIPVAALMMNTLLPYYFSQTLGLLVANNQTLVWQNLFIASCVGLGGALANMIGFQFLTRHEANIRSNLGNDTFISLIKKDVRFFVNEKVGALTSRYIDFVTSYVELQDLLIMRTLGFVLSISIGLIIVFAKSQILALIIAGLIIALILQVKWSVKKRAKWRHIRKNLTGEIHGEIADAFTNNLIVKTFANEDSEINNLRKKHDEYRHAFIKDIGFLGYEGSARLTVMMIIQIVAVGLCSYFITKNIIDIATTIFVLTYLQRLSTQVFELGGILNGYDQALLKAAPLSDMLQKETLINDSPDAIKLIDISPNIEFENVSYRYNDTDEEVIQNLNLSVRAGEKIGLVGNSGAGKTTITHLLLRFSDVSEGSVKIGGHDIRDVTQESLRKSIAYVPQEPMLFHRTLRENIAYGKPDASEEEIVNAAKKASALEFIEKIPHGLDAIVGERGIKLSGGQRQRIAIARAILKDAPILILDEATSALDSENEKLIQAALVKLMAGRTSIVIAHRLSTIAKMDRIIVLEDGKIYEQGTHKELLAKNGIYAKLWSHQSGGFIDD
ncbi:ABC transporter ATP-binding protein [Candidatus Saccharibacteria bacterium]|nr:ABC transporter ATP-binding protein [Candidatus Saccharibacteria bacterium]